MSTRIQLRRDTAANWGSNNTILANGEPGYDTTNNKIKIGDGTTAWSSLAYTLTGPEGPHADGVLHSFLLMGA
tara:strand:+ start:284 stop:502 length:219 start_codon:yes stop_codon:yes gene_type:complete